MPHRDRQRHHCHPADPGDAADRRLPVRARCRSLRPSADADGRRSAVFASRICLRVRAESHCADRAARPLRYRHGWRVGVGASLAMETIPPKSRGFVSGLLQAGYPSGYLIASVVYATLFPIIGWRGMFMIGVLPAFLVLYIRRAVPESPSWQATAPSSGGTLTVLRSHWKLGLYAALLMTAFNFYSHGTQDLYPTFLQVQHHFSPQVVGTIAVIYNIGAILGGISFGMLSQRIGRRRAIVLATLLSLPIVPLWAFSTTPILLAVGAFLMQFMVQGAWGVIPVHLNELSPDEARGTFPGFVYQLGNLLASANATIQAAIAVHYGNDYALALTLVVVIVAIIIAAMTGFGVEAKDVAFGRGRLQVRRPASGGT